MKLKYLREQAGLSQYELAPKLKLGRATYANYETGKTEPNIETLKNIAAFYGVSLDYLCDFNSKNTDLGYLTPKQYECIEVLKQLNDEDLILATGFIKGLLVKKN